MKKTLVVLSALTAAAAFAATEVSSGNSFGFVPVTGQSEGLKAIAVPVAGYSATSGSQSIKISEILQTGNLTKGDKLYTLADGGTYNEYTLKADGTWEASRVVTVGANGAFTVESGTPASDATIQRGKAFWINTQAMQINLMGQATTDAAQTAPVPELSTGWNLVGSTSMTQPLKISDIPGTKGDNVYVGTTGYQYTQASGATTGVWKNKSTMKAVTDSDVIPVGVGAKIRHQQQ